jgi:hypothetical protein
LDETGRAAKSQESRTLPWALAGAKRTLLHTITLPGIPSISNGLNVTVSRDGKNYAYQYHPVISTEYLVEGLR